MSFLLVALDYKYLVPFLFIPLDGKLLEGREVPSSPAKRLPHTRCPMHVYSMNAWMGKWMKSWRVTLKNDRPPILSLDSSFLQGLWWKPCSLPWFYCSEGLHPYRMLSPPATSDSGLASSPLCSTRLWPSLKTAEPGKVKMYPILELVSRWAHTCTHTYTHPHAQEGTVNSAHWLWEGD